MNKIIAYQAVSNGYDKPHPPKGLLPCIDYELRVGSVTNDHAALWNRRHKILCPPVSHEFSLYMDGNIEMRVGDRAMAAAIASWLATSDIALFRHPNRKCAYVEIEACVGRGKIKHAQAEIAHKKLLEIGLPKNYGLWACGVIARRNGVAWIEKLQRRWFELTQLVCRDQLWLTAALYELGVTKPTGGLASIDADIFDNPLFTYKQHNHDRSVEAQR